MWQTVFIATLFGTVLFESNHESLLLCHHQAIFKAWHLAMGCRRTIGRSDRAKPHQTDTALSFEERSSFQQPMILKTVFKSTMVVLFGKHFTRHCVWCHHQRIFQVWQLATGLQKPMGRSDRAKLLQSGSSVSCQGSRRSARTTRISEVCTSKLFDGNFNPWGLKEKLPVPF